MPRAGVDLQRHRLAANQDGARFEGRIEVDLAAQMSLGKIAPRDVDAKQRGDGDLHLRRDLKPCRFNCLRGIRRERSADPTLVIAVLQPFDVQLIGWGEVHPA